MIANNVTITRAELYEKVWKIPMRTLAREFGLSDVGLAKLCRRYNIPTPGLGHWRLVETGHPPERTPLPPVASQQDEIIKITAREVPPYLIPKKNELPPTPRVRVGNDREITHPLAIRTKKAFEPTSKDEQGRFVPNDLKAPHLRVSNGAGSRALRILDALLSAAETQKYSVIWEDKPKAQIHLIVDGQKIWFSILERFTRQPHSPTSEEIARKKKNLYVHMPQWDYEPSGALQLSFEHMPYDLKGIRKSWSDATTQRVENCLTDFIAVLPYLAKALKVLEEEHERKRRQWQEEERLREEQRRKQAEYDRKSKVADELLNFWNRSKAFRDLATSINEALERCDIDDKQKAEVREIADWIARHAENNNPMADFNWMIRKFKEPAFVWPY